MIVLNALLVDEIRKHPAGQVDLVGVYEDIYLESIPATIENIQLFLDLGLDDSDRGEKHQITLHLLMHQTQEAIITPLQIRFDVPSAAQFSRDTAQLDLAFFNVTFPAWGRFEIVVFLDDTEQRRLPLYVLSRTG
jgi:hypothetical protein